MNIQQAIDAVLAKGEDTDADVDVFLRHFDLCELGWSPKFNSRVRARYVETWLCTDTWVGTAVVFFDQKPLAITSQSARKSRAQVRFLAVPDAEVLLTEFKAFLMTLQEDEGSAVTLVPLTDELELRDVAHYDKFYKCVAA